MYTNSNPEEVSYSWQVTSGRLVYFVWSPEGNTEMQQ
ncbi:hypothetical protein OOU_Y34scaffold00514g18 [Pyricularia oryzae Y34]|uniref:Uncharacterized protein n=1 Tax=Pyricularia oryzae (strain Y34) TaxID=1143189 RepID=A0AA97NZE1_PYRO3|nr:hypothetical protein OOU_Y34scaffold00514g18 [Pyricularia oryzae Y34]